MRREARGYSLEFIEGMITEEAGQLSGWINDLELKSIFQAAFSLPHASAMGFEASLRSKDAQGHPISPAALFGPVQNYAEALMLDMLCTTLHVRNYAAAGPQRGLLLVNLHPEVLLDFENSVPFISTLLSTYAVRADSVMLDVPGAILENPELKDAVAAYRELGCLIAIDDFGDGNANLDTIWNVSPVVVKLDRSLLVQASSDSRIRRMLPKAVSLLHEMGTLVLIEGVESEDDAEIALDVDADFASGYHLGPMRNAIADISGSSAAIRDAWHRYRKNPPPPDKEESPARSQLNDAALFSSSIGRLRNASPREIARYREARRPFVVALADAGARLQAGQSVEQACGEFLGLEGAIRCFVLDGEGVQSTAPVMSRRTPGKTTHDFHKGSGTPQTNWTRRDFFRRAVKEPGVVQVTRQYCSLDGYAHCVTFSLLVSVAYKPVILCGDVDWTSHAAIHAMASGDSR